MKVVLEGKTFELKFGFKCFMLLGKELGLETFSEVVQKFTSFSDMKDDISFEQLELIEKLVVASAEAHPHYYNLEYAIYEISVIDAVMAKPELLTEIMTAFSNSFPKHVGKQPAKKTIRKTK